jgi:hypothetical protein
MKSNSYSHIFQMFIHCRPGTGHCKFWATNSCVKPTRHKRDLIPSLGRGTGNGRLPLRWIVGRHILILGSRLCPVAGLVLSVCELRVVMLWYETRKCRIESDSLSVVFFFFNVLILTKCSIAYSLRSTFLHIYIYIYTVDP